MFWAKQIPYQMPNHILSIHYDIAMNPEGYIVS